jgi:uncharacterized protein
LLKLLKNNSIVILVVTLLSAVYVFLALRGDNYLRYDIDGQLIASRVQEFITFFLSITIEAFPFVVLGVLISVIVNLFFKAEWMLRILPKNRILNHFVISLFGMFLPVCECGNVPVARSLISKNFTVSQSVTFLLSAPIINPITIWATIEAFRPDSTFVIVRVLAALVISNLIGIIISFKKDQNTLLTEKFYAEVCEHDHDHSKNKLGEAFEIFQNEFINVMKLLCLGAIFAALTQIFIPRELITSIGQSPFLSIISMMLFAFVISICSNVDAFVVLPYVSTFTIGSIMSFLVFGPLVDMKIITMLKGSFKWKLLLFISVTVGVFSLLLGLIVNYFI